MSIRLFFNTITAFVNAQFIAILEFFDACKIEKFCLFLQPLFGCVLELVKLVGCGTCGSRTFVNVMVYFLKSLLSRNVWSMKLRVQDQGEDQRRPGKRLYVKHVR